jgi:acetyl-CoA synthetase
MIHIKTESDHVKFTEIARRDPDQFWLKVASSFVWHKAPEKVSEGKIGEKLSWFEDGSLNITENCLDRHVKTQPQKIALIWEPNRPEEAARRFTYEELSQEVGVFANTLRNMGVRKGDRVVIYMAMIPELMFSVLACARLGAVHCVVFAGFSAKSLAARIEDSGASFVVLSSGAARGAKSIPLKSIVDEALDLSTDLASSVKGCLVIKHTEEPVTMKSPRDIWYHEASKGVSGQCEAVAVGGEDPLFILYIHHSTVYIEISNNRLNTHQLHQMKSRKPLINEPMKS